MSQSQGIEVRRPSRRTIASGAAWAVPVIAVGAAAPFAAASPPPCVPEFQIVPDQSFKCCNAGKVKNMKLTVKVTDVSNCISAGSEICIVDVKIDAGGAKEIGSIVFEPGGDSICVAENTNFTVYLLDTDTCTVNLLVGYQIGGTGPVRYTPIKSDNVAGGNLGDGTPGACEPAN
jgi:hypothetical protein